MKIRTVLVSLVALALLAGGCVVRGHVAAHAEPVPVVVTTQPAPPPPTIVVSEPTPPPPTIIVSEPTPPPPTVVVATHPVAPTPPPPTVVVATQPTPPPPTIVVGSQPTPVPPVVATPPGPPPPTIVGLTPCTEEGATAGCPAGTICGRHGNLELACRTLCQGQDQCGAAEQCIGAAHINRRICIPR